MMNNSMESVDCPYCSHGYDPQSFEDGEWFVCENCKKKFRVSIQEIYFTFTVCEDECLHGE
jgi:transposase-like protein